MKCNGNTDTYINETINKDKNIDDDIPIIWEGFEISPARIIDTLLPVDALINNNIVYIIKENDIKIKELEILLELSNIKNNNNGFSFSLTTIYRNIQLIIIVKIKLYTYIFNNILFIHLFNLKKLYPPEGPPLLTS